MFRISTSKRYNIAYTTTGADSRLIRHNEQGFESPVLEINVDIFNDGLRPDDAGVYICNGINEDRNSVHYQTRITISVFGKNKHYIL